MKKMFSKLTLGLVGLLGLSQSASALTITAADIDFTDVIANLGVIAVAIIGLYVVLIGIYKVWGALKRG